MIKTEYSKEIKNNIDIKKLNNYLINKINILNEIYEITIFNIWFIKSNFKKNPLKKLVDNEKWKIYLFLSENDLLYLNNFLEENFDIIEKDINDIIEENLIWTKYLVENEWYDEKDLIIEEIKIRKKLENEYIEIANYIWEKIKLSFIKYWNEKLSNNYTDNLINKYNNCLAKIKYIYMKI